MTTSFIVNLEDLNRILENIKIAEAHSAGGNLADLVNQAAGGTAAAIIPFGLRTVDGSYNNLLPGDTLVGAADQNFPRLLTPTWRNDMDGDTITLPGGGPTITRTDYNSALSVVDADPRIISNLIVDNTINNPSALRAALTLAVPGTVGPDDATAWIEATATALLDAYNAWKAADPASDAEWSAKALVYTSAIAEATTVKSHADAALTHFDSLITRLADDILDGDELTSAQAAKTSADAAVTAQLAVIDALDRDFGDAGDDLPELAAAITLLAKLQDLAAAADAAVNAFGNGSISLSEFNAMFLAKAKAEEASGIAATDKAALEAAGSDALNHSSSALETAFNDLVAEAGIDISPDNSIMIPHQSADIGLSPPNSGWMTLFGQFFDHGLDLVTKGGNGTVYIPLQVDDPLYDKGWDGTANTMRQAFDADGNLLYLVPPPPGSPPGTPPTFTTVDNGNPYMINDDGLGADGLLGTYDDRPNFMALTRATQMDAARNTQNTTTPFVDQNQTYTSIASHQVFLREYALDENGHAINTGRLLNGANGGIANWGEVKAQAQNLLGLKLSDFDVHDVPQLEVDPYGKFIAGANGYAQVVVNIDVVNSTGTVVGSVTSLNGNFTVEGTSGGLNLRTIAIGDVNLQGQTLAALAPGLSYVVSVAHTGHAFLNDIAHHAAPGQFDSNGDGRKDTNQTADVDILDYNGDGVVNQRDVDLAVAAGKLIDANNDGNVDMLDLADVNLDGVIDDKDSIADDRNPTTYDDEMLNAHFVTGDGRGNENIGLTAVHTIFHSEHNRVLDANKVTLIKSFDAGTVNQWLRADTTGANAQVNQVTQAQLDAIKALDPAAQETAIADLINTLDTNVSWDGERLFQAARFTTEMQYQHMVFEEFARRVQPNVDPFVFTNSADIDPSIVAEFAHVVYRFGHSQLTDTVDRLTNDLTFVNDPTSPNGQIGLIEAFLNPQSFTASGANDETATGAIIRGMSRQVGNEIDEFVVEALRNNLVGLPLDLAVLNMARGRDTGVPGLNEARAQLYAASGHVDVKPYGSWAEFGEALKHPLSLVNFLAAYGTHSSITSAATLEAKRAAAVDLYIDGFIGTDITTDAYKFVHAQGPYADSDLGGLNTVDFWIGGLAEQHAEFGGQLGSTFNFVFEYQLEHLQNGDRFYYLSRTQGMNLLNLLEANTFSDIIMRNTDLGDVHATHLSAEIMEVPDMILELDGQVAQENYSENANPATRWDLDPSWDNAANGGPKIVRIMNDLDANGNNVGVQVNGNPNDYDNMLKFRGGEHVVLGGTEGNDVLLGDKGIDTLWGDGGNDYLNAGTESDQVFGGDGDDIIEDPFGDDFLRGEAGDDVVVSGAGIDVLFGGIGNDFVQIVTDSSEIFAGPGDDFLLGGSAPDALLGNEGDDWIEGGEGFDSLSGENSELFFNSPIVGHDILWGQANDTDYDGENGDDIMVQGSGIQRNNGMDGFDWAIHKGDTKADGTATDAVSDMTNLLGIGAVNPAFILRDRFDSVEGLSGWDGNDTLLGASLLVVAGGGFDSKLTQAGVDRINGLKYVIGTVGDGVNPITNGDPNATVLTNDHAFNGGEIILGGSGSDLMMGALGDDIMDGDAWLNVRISVHQNKVPVGVNNQDIDTDPLNGNPEIATVDSLLSKLKLGTAGSLGPNETSNATWVGKSLADLMRSGELNPGQLKAVREVLNSDGSQVTAAGTTDDGSVVADQFTGDVDTAAFRFGIDEYVIEGNDDNNDGFIRGLEIRDTNNDGYIRVEHVPVGRGGGALRNADGIDQIRNFEVLEFADSTQIIQQGLINNPATGTLNLQISANGPFHAAASGQLAVGDTLTVSLTDPDAFPDALPPTDGPLTAVADADGLPPISAFSFTWQQSIVDDTGAIIGWEDIVDPITEEVITGQSFTPTAAFLLDGLSLRVVGRFVDGHGIREIVTSIVQGPLVGTAPLAPDPAAVLGLRTGVGDPLPGDGTVPDTLLDLTGTIDPAGDAVPQAVDANNANIPTFGIFEDGGTLTITKDQLLQFVGDIDTTNAALVVQNLALRIRAGDPNPGTLVNNNNNTWTFTPAENFNGGIVFTFDISDGTNVTPAEAVLDVLAVNDAPTNPNALLGTTPAGIGAVPVSFSIAQLFGSTPVDGGGRPIDIDGDRLTIDPATVSSPTGTVAFNAGTGIFTWTPNAGALSEAVDVVINFQIDDGTGLANAVTNATARIDAVNVAPTGSVTISDTTPAEGQTLSVNTASIADVNGLGPLTITWQASADFGAASPVITTLGTGTSITVPGLAVGQSVRAVATYTDQGGTVESVLSAPTAAVIANATPTGAPVISEVITATNPATVQITPTEGQQLTATALGIADADGITLPITFQWQSSANGTTWTNIVGATNATFTPQDLAGSLPGAQAGLQLRVLANFVDGLGKPESVASLATAPVGANWTATPFLANTFNGTAGDDIAVGTNGIPILGGANDTLNGNAGNDRLSGAGGTDTLNGGADNDILAGNAGNDTINGGTGSDTIIWSGGDGRDLIDGGTTAVSAGLDTSTDTFVVNGDGTAEAFRIYTKAAFLAVAGNALAPLNTNTEIVVTRNGTNFASVIAELDNIEEIVVNGFDTTTNNNDGVVNGGTAGGDTITVIGNFAPPNTSLNFSTITINGSSSGDIVDISQLSSEHRIVFNTGGGSDQVVGALRSQDVVNGDIAYANVATNKADVFYGLNGKYAFAGLKGNDVYIVDADDKIAEGRTGGTDEVRTWDLNIDLAKYANVENAMLLGDQAISAKGTNLANRLDGEQNSAGNALSGLGGNDTYVVGAGDSIVETRGGGLDTVSSHSINLSLANYANVENLSLLGAANLELEGNDANNVLTGNDGNNVLKGGKGNDNLNGGLGDDQMEGGTGNDLYNTSLGNDTIVIRASFGNDRVSGFDADAAGGQDRIDLSALQITEATFSEHVKIVDMGLHTLVKIDGGTLRLDGVRDHTTVTIEDFILFAG